MSVKCIINVSHNGRMYSIGDTIIDITLNDAEKLIECGAVIKLDDKFKRNYQNYKKVFRNKYRKNKNIMEELQYAKF